MYTATCKFEGKTYTDTKSVVVETKVTHTYGAPVFQWDELVGGGYKCSAAFSCQYGDDVQTIDATVTSKDEITQGTTKCDKVRKTVYTATCKFEGKTYTDTKAVVVETKVTHTYGEPEFNWLGTIEKGYTCEAIFRCKNCTDQQKVVCNVTSQSTDGKVTYTASCKFDEKTFSNTKTVQVEPQPTSGGSQDPQSSGGSQNSQPSVSQGQIPVMDNKPITDLQILNKDIKLVKNHSITLELQITPNDTTETGLRFTSSNDTIATITKERVITGHKAGTAIITVSTADGRLTRKVNVEVGEAASSIQLNHTKLTLVKNETAILSATITPKNVMNKEVQYVSKNKSVATVDQNGKVTAVGTGTTHIMVNTMDGSGIKAKCKVIVKQKVTKLSISSIKAQTYTGKKIKPQVIIKDGNYKLVYGKDYSLKWNSNTKPGKAYITVKGKGNYTGTVKIYFIIKPAKVGLSSVKSSKAKTGVATWKSMEGVTGYKVYFKTSEKGSYKLAGKTKKASYKISKLKSNSTVYVKVRAYKLIDGEYVYGAYSKVIKVKVK